MTRTVDKPPILPAPSLGWDPLAAVGRFERLHARLFGLPSPTAKVGRYELGERLGHGASGCVHRGTDPVLRRSVAVKLIAIPPELDEAQCEALMAEAHALAAVDHPGLVKVHDAGICVLEDLSGAMVLPRAIAEQRTVYLVMELVEGPPLHDWLARGRSISQVLAVFTRLGEALGAAHRAGIIHRDFKPRNVAFDAAGRPKILDFGLAGPALTDDPARISGSAVIGTPAFMAPEQHDGQPGDARADQFAYCVSVWTALAGEQPFAGPSIDAFRAQKLARETGSNFAIRRSLRAVLLRGLAPNPSDRWPTMEELTRALVWAKRRRGLAIGALATIVATGFAAFQLSPDNPCAIGPNPGEIWSEGRQDRLHAVLSDAIPIGAAETEAVVAGRFDALESSWREQHEVACALEDSERSRALECLDDASATARGVFEATVRHPGARVFELLDLLPVPAECLAPGLASAPAMSAYRDDIVLYRSRFRLGQLEPVLQHAVQVLDDPTLPDAVRAEWLLISGLALAGRGRMEEAHETLRAAWTLAEKAGNERAAASALLALAASLTPTDPKQARMLLELADTMRPSLSARRRVALDATWAQYHLNVSGDVEAAMERWDAVADGVGGMENASSTAVAITSGVAQALIEKGEFEDAEQRLTRMLEGAELGRTNPFVAGLVVTRGTSRWLRGDLAGATTDLTPTEVDLLASETALGLELLVRVSIARGEPAIAERAIAAYRDRHPTVDGPGPALVADAGLALFRGELSAAQRFPKPREFNGADWELDLLAAGQAIVAGRPARADEHLEDAVARMERLRPRGRQLLALDTAALMAWTGDVERAARLLDTARESPGLQIRTRAEITAARVRLWAGDGAAQSDLDRASSLLTQYPSPWVEGEAEVALLRSVALARDAEHDAALRLASGAVQSCAGRGTLGLVEAAALLARDIDAEHTDRVQAWALELGRASGVDEALLSWLLRRPEVRVPAAN